MTKAKKKENPTVAPVEIVHMQMRERMLTTPQFCQWANISRPTFYKLREAGKIKVTKISEKLVRVRGEDALHFLDSKSA